MDHRKRLYSFLLLVLIYLAFISLGLPDSALGIAWPLMRQEWHQGLGDVGAVVTLLTLFSALSGFASGWVLKRFSTGIVVWASGLMTALAMVGISLAPSFPWLFFLAVPLGLGAGSVDSGLNHYAAKHFSARHMNWLHGFWGVGAWMGPLILAWALQQPGAWRTGYGILGFIQLGLSVLFLASLPLWGKKETSGDTGSEEAEEKILPAPAWTFWGAPFLFFLYTGLETGTALWTSSFLIGKHQAEPAVAALLVSVFYGSLMGGRFLTGLITRWVSNRRLIHGGLAVALAGTLVMAAGWGGLPAATAALVMIGLGCAPVFPGMMHETPRRFGEEGARKVVGRQVAFAALGGATLPGLLGVLGSLGGLQFIFPAIAVITLLMLLISLFLERTLSRSRTGKPQVLSS